MHSCMIFTGKSGGSACLPIKDCLIQVNLLKRSYCFNYCLAAAIHTEDMWATYKDIWAKLVVSKSAHKKKPIYFKKNMMVVVLLSSYLESVWECMGRHGMWSSGGDIFSAGLGIRILLEEHTYSVCSGNESHVGNLTHARVYFHRYLINNCAMLFQG